jgi:hypothetical protein
MKDRECFRAHQGISLPFTLARLYIGYLIGNISQCTSGVLSHFLASRGCVNENISASVVEDELR